MSMQQIQMVIIDLEDGSRGVFVGTPRTSDQCMDDDCTVVPVWFTHMQSIPQKATLEQVVQMALAQIEAPTMLQ